MTSTLIKPWFTPSPSLNTLGEAPLYRPSDSTLHWVDPLSTPPTLQILRINAETGSPIGEARTLQLESSVSIACFRQDRPGYIVGYETGIAFMSEEDGKLEILKDVIGPEWKGKRRFNDGGVDAKGRFWVAEIDLPALILGAGNIPSDFQPQGRLWRYDPDGTLHQMADGIFCGNAVEWSPDNKTFYLDDSIAQKCYAFDFDLESGNISNKRLMIDFTGTKGEPDGMVVDTEGNLYISVFGTSSVMVFDPAGKKLRDIVFSGKKVTCPAWGGKEFDKLFVTSASLRVEDGDEGGSVFSWKAEDKVKGIEKNKFAG